MPPKKKAGGKGKGKGDDEEEKMKELSKILTNEVKVVEQRIGIAYTMNSTRRRKEQ